MNFKYKIVTSLFFLIFNLFSFSSEKKEIRIGLLMSSGGMASGFNRMAYNALERLKSENKIGDFKYIEPQNEAEDAQFLSDFSHGDFDLVIGMGSVVAESLKDIQKKFPNQKYALVGGTDTIPNTITVDFAEHEISFLAGALAAMMSKSQVVGTIPALNNRSFNRFSNGFRQGARYINPKIEVLNTYMPSSSSDPFSDPVSAKNIALLMNSRKADVIFHIAENSGSGVFQAAKEKGFFAIGCDEDEDGKFPGTILTSTLIRIDNGVYNLVDKFSKGEFTPGYSMSTLAENGVSLTEFNYTKDIIGEENLKKLEAIRKEINLGKIKVSE